MLESTSHATSSFVTLTFAWDKYTPSAPLQKEYYQDWLKRFRKRVAPERIRYFIVGEYGTENWRPHFHAALFGAVPCIYNPGPSRSDVYARKNCNCSPCAMLRDSWGHGLTDNGSLTEDSAQYIAGYVTKKMTKADDPRLLGRPPEFAQPSLDGGIGAPAMPAVLDAITTEQGCELIAQRGDVPMSLQHGRKSRPLGRYLRAKLRELYGFPKDVFTDSRTPRESKRQHTAEMLSVFQDLKALPEHQGKALGQTLVDANAQKVLNLETRFKLYNNPKGNV